MIVGDRTVDNSRKFMRGDKRCHPTSSPSTHNLHSTLSTYPVVLWAYFISPESPPFITVCTDRPTATAASCPLAFWLFHRDRISEPNPPSDAWARNFWSCFMFSSCHVQTTNFGNWHLAWPLAQGPCQMPIAKVALAAAMVGFLIGAWT